MEHGGPWRYLPIAMSTVTISRQQECNGKRECRSIILHNFHCTCM